VLRPEDTFLQCQRSALQGKCGGGLALQIMLVGGALQGGDFSFQTDFLLRR